MGIANDESDARTRAHSESTSCKIVKIPIAFAKPWQCAHLLAPLFLCLPLRFLQLLFDLLFFAANVAQVTLEKRELRFLRVRVVE